MKILLILFHLIYASPSPTDIVGQWVSKNKDLKIEVFEKNGKYYGKMMWFVVYEKGKTMDDFKDVKNPNQSLRNRQWKEMIVLEDLRFNKQGYWSDGRIYDPNSGHTFSSLVKPNGSQSIIVRGFLGFEILGKSLEFSKIK